MPFEDAIAQWRNDPAFAQVLVARASLDQRRSVPEGLLADPIRESWLRCIAFGLRADSAPPVRCHDAGALSQLLDAQQALLAAADPELERLERLLAADGAIVALADAEATVLRVRGRPEAMEVARQVTAVPGSHWPEDEQGTNALGTVLRERRPLTVRGGEHFFTRHTLFSCAAAPIFDVSGELLGALNVSAMMPRELPDALGWVAAAVRAIERRLYRAAGKDFVMLDLHGRREFIGTPWAGIALFDASGVLRALSDEAARELGQARRQLIGRRFDELFDRDFEAWLSVARLVGRPLHTPGGRAIHAAIDTWTENRASSFFGTGATAVSAPATALSSIALGDTPLLRQLEKAAQVFVRQLPVMIQGETGVGKEMLARALHQSADARSPFVAINCAALPESLIEAELFGYGDGAFTGARRGGSPGRIREADGGTLFLDEIGDMPLATQARLLRVLQERVVTPLGGGKAIPVAFRLITATHRDLLAGVAAQSFREDLYFRIHGYSIRLPALRERAHLPRVIDSVLAREAAALGLPAAQIAPALREALCAYRWPGNLRELAMVLRTALALLDADEHEIGERHLNGLFANILVRAAPPAAMTAEAPSAVPRTTLRAAEHALILDTLARCGGNVSAAAAALGISRVSIYRKLKAAGIDHRRRLSS